MSKAEELELLQKELKLLRWEEQDREVNPHRYFDLYNWQDEFIYQHDHIKNHGRFPHRLYLTAANQVGKLLTHHTKVPTPSGWVNHGDLKVGDYVFGQNGKKTKVVGVYDHKDVECYKITFSDGSTIEAGDEHLWICKGERERFRKYHRVVKHKNGTETKSYNDGFGKWVVKSTKQIIEDGKYNTETKARLRHTIPITKPVEYSFKGLFDPYLVGLLLGDGTLVGTPQITTVDEDVFKYIENNYESTRLKSGKDISILGKIPKMKEIGIFGKRAWEKEIPRDYLMGSESERKLLLAGLMDSDGSIASANKSMEYTTVSEELKEGFEELVTSLGGTYRTSERYTTYTHKGEKKTGRKSYRIRIFLQFNPFRLSRKTEIFRVQERYLHERVITKIEPIGKRDANCIEVDNKDHSYLATKNHIVTHNTVSLMLLAHRLCTDKEFRQWHWGSNQPRVMWYVLPSLDHINDFFDEKWEPEILSRDEAKATGPYAWKVIKKNGAVKGIHFLATNCKLNFVTLGAKGSALQGRSVGAMIFDEEPDERKLGELEMRTASFNDPVTGLSKAILAFAFTPTTAQDYFKRIFQFQDKEFLAGLPKDLLDEYFLDKHLNEYRTCSIQEEQNERFKRSSTVWKRRVSMFEAMKFKSGKRGKYTKERIYELIKSQPTTRDILVRVFAQFEKDDDGGKVYKYFKRENHLREVEKNYIKGFKTKKGLLTAGIDYGSGSNHPGGYAILWVSPERDKVKVVKMWRGEKGKVTTAGDIIEKYIEAIRGWKIDFPFYDYACKDLATIYNRMTGKELYKAEKSHDIGVGLVDTLYKHNMLELLSPPDEPYGEWAAVEYENLSNKLQKKDRSDELSDCIRYGLAGIAHMFNLEELAEITSKQDLIQKVEELKTPEDYGVRSWANVPDQEDESEWKTNELSDWEDLFNE